MRINKIGTAAAALATVVIFAGGCSLFSSSSPTATFKAFYEASKKKDAAAIKKTMSKGTIEMMEKMAKDQGKSLDDMLKESKTGKDTPDKLPEMRNEKIDGDKATLEVKRTESGSDWDTMPFVKEDGEWKLAFDKFIEELMNKMKEKMPTP